jgi:hypothetical protein
MKSARAITTAQAHDLPATHRGVGFPHAFHAILEHLPLSLSRQPSTPLRVLALMAISASLRSRALVLTTEQRRALILMMELGALLNNRFDGDSYDPGAVRRILAWFRRSRFRPLVTHHIAQLRNTERNRPHPHDGLEVIRLYRERVNLLSLATLWSIASNTDPANTMARLGCQNDLNLHFRTIMLIQLIDDIIDRRHDARRRLPSFASPPDSAPEKWRTIIHGYATHEVTGNLPPRVTLAACKRIALLLTRLAAPRR